MIYSRKINVLKSERFEISAKHAQELKIRAF